MMRTMEVELRERSYPIYVGSGILQEVGRLCAERRSGDRAAVISSASVAALYLRPVVDSLKRSGYRPIEIVVPDGEGQKTLQVAEGIYGRMIEAGLGRDCVVAALGGGVIGDLAGFVAATYMRGVDLVHIPTTILAQVDSSIGGKVAVDHRQGKNLVGSFHQPLFVLSDTDTLRTLPEVEIQAGMAEVAKHGMALDQELFDLLETRLEEFLRISTANQGLLNDLIERNCRIKVSVVSRDERDHAGLRDILNYGHTVGHALEAATSYEVYRHGEAVLLGMVGAARISRLSGALSTEDEVRQNALLARIEVPRMADITDGALVDRMRVDKKVRSGKIRFVLADRIGSAHISERVTEEDILEALAWMREWADR